MEKNTSINSAVAVALLAQCASLSAEPIGPHLDDNQYVDYEGGFLPAAEFRRVDDHLTSCLECATRMDEFYQSMSTRLHPAVRAVLSPSHRRRSQLLRNWVPAGMAAALLAVVGWLAFGIYEKNESLAVVANRQLAESQARIQTLESQLQVARSERPAPERFAKEPEQIARAIYNLRSDGGVDRGASRGSESEGLKIERNIRVVELRLDLAEISKLSNYSVKLYDEDAHTLALQRDGLQASVKGGRSTLIVLVPGSKLKPGRFTASVETHGETVASYAFTVRR